jgi:hypothetical protein
VFDQEIDLSSSSSSSGISGTAGESSFTTKAPLLWSEPRAAPITLNRGAFFDELFHMNFDPPPAKVSRPLLLFIIVFIYNVFNSIDCVCS